MTKYYKILVPVRIGLSAGGDITLPAGTVLATTDGEECGGCGCVSGECGYIELVYDDDNYMFLRIEEVEEYDLASNTTHTPTR